MREGEFREFPNLSPPRHLKNSPDTFTLEILKETLRSEEFMKNISFIIPVFNEEKNLRKTFAALNQVSLPRGVKLVEIIFIDNGSRDRTFAKLSNLAQESYTLPISIVSYKKRLSAKDAAKEGIKHSISKTNIVLKSDLSNLDKEIKKLSTKPKRKNKPPQVSVIMPVYNSQSYLDKAIKSVLSQTFRDFEFIIIDDHSSDKSWNIIKRYTRRSKKIRSFRNNKKMGLATSVKQGVTLARGDYVTKIDSDDLCYKTRFEKQVKYLNRNRRTVAVGTQYLFVNEKGKKLDKKVRPSLFEKTYERVYRFLPVQQPALMIAKKRLPREFDFYNYEAESLEDTELVYKLSKYGRVENLPYTLLRYRIDNGYSFLSMLRKIYFLLFISRIKAAI